MELSQQKQKEAKKLGVPVSYMLMADLIAIGYNDHDAYTIAYPENAALSAQQNKGIRDNILSSAKFKKVYDERSTLIKSGVTMPAMADEVELISTEEVIKEILISARRQPFGSKERADLFAKYNDIKTKNDVGTVGEDNISFFFPLKCNQCPLLYAYNEQMKNNGGKEIKPVEMGKVLDVAGKIIKAAMDAE